MSRSYIKYLSVPHYEFDPPEWYSFRAKEKRCILDELRNPESEYGDVIFPRYYGSRRGSWYSSKRHYRSIKEIRNGYLKEIRDILNGFRERCRYWGKYIDDYEEFFIIEFNLIKNIEGPKRRRYHFVWLDNREAKEAVKTWDGDPVDILYYLVNAGIIERAVRLEVKWMLRK
jgi:hypothetical protein